MARTEETRPETGGPDEGERQAKEAELLRKLPDDADDAQERGERHETGKDIATGGKDRGE